MSASRSLSSGTIQFPQPLVQRLYMITFFLGATQARNAGSPVIWGADFLLLDLFQIVVQFSYPFLPPVLVFGALYFFNDFFIVVGLPTKEEIDTCGEVTVLTRKSVTAVRLSGPSSQVSGASCFSSHPVGRELRFIFFLVKSLQSRLCDCHGDVMKAAQTQHSCISVNPTRVCSAFSIDGLMG